MYTTVQNYLNTFLFLARYELSTKLQTNRITMILLFTIATVTREIH